MKYPRCHNCHHRCEAEEEWNDGCLCFSDEYCECMFCEDYG